jgi:hypothetical protein
MHRVLLLGFGLVLTACGSPDASAPASKPAPAVSPEVATAPGRLYLSDGQVLPADEWWEDGTILFYRWHGQQLRVLREYVVRIEGEPRKRVEVVGPLGTDGPSSSPKPQSANKRDGKVRGT